MKEKPPAFEDLSRDEQVAIVRKLMSEGHTYKTASEAIPTGLGRVARICRDYGIPSIHSRQAGSPKKAVKPKREPPVTPPTEVPSAPPSPPAFPAASSVREPLKTAASEATQCMQPVLGEKRCAFVRVPGTLFCEMHQPKK